MDVGANIGIMSLQFARLVPQGRVYAFEPTHYALSKLQNNLALNPGLAKRIQVTQAFVAEAPGEIELVAYSSWRIDGHRAGDEHPVHGGAPQATQGIPATSIDAVVAQERLQRLDFIKIDTDGHEYDVLQGAMHTLEQLRPQVIFELGLYVMKERGISFQHYQDLFEKMNYRLYLSHNKKPIHAQNYTQHIPARGTIDVLALPTASS
jgi:FkbM family methyltransferase